VGEVSKKTRGSSASYGRWCTGTRRLAVLRKSQTQRGEKKRTSEGLGKTVRAVLRYSWYRSEENRAGALTGGGDRLRKSGQ